MTEMITYKIYPLPGICDKSKKGSLAATDINTLDDLLSAISNREDVDFAIDLPFLVMLDGKTLELSESRDLIVGDGSELLILPALMGG
jgi:hypothetical protein